MALRDAGASAGVPLTVEQLARRVREAYDPETAAEFAELEAEGLGMHVEWADAGPSAHDEFWDTYTHDSGLSRTYEALRVPAGVVRDTVLTRLTQPMESAPRKRVTLLYRPVDAGATAEVVDRDLKAAINRTGRRKGLVHAPRRLGGTQHPGGLRAAPEPIRRDLVGQVGQQRRRFVTGAGHRPGRGQLVGAAGHRLRPSTTRGLAIASSSATVHGS